MYAGKSLDAAQAVGDPRADAGASGKLKSGLAKRDCRIVIDGIGFHRLDNTSRRQLADPRNSIADPGPRLAMLRNLKMDVAIGKLF